MGKVLTKRNNKH